MNNGNPARDVGPPKIEQALPSLKPAHPEGGRLGARPGVPSIAGMGPGLHPLGLERDRDGLIYVPSGYRPGQPAPLVLMLHGAGGNARGGIDPLLGLADEKGLVLVAPDSRGRTWDVILGAFGPDVRFIDRALRFVFDRFQIDPARIAVEGFSDGASYALSVGLTNGDLFGYVMAFSPGFSAPGEEEGSPAIFISHGTADPVLPISRTSRRIVPLLVRRGYDVRYEEFEGGHAVPGEMVRAATDEFLAGVAR